MDFCKKYYDIGSIICFVILNRGWMTRKRKNIKLIVYNRIGSPTPAYTSYINSIDLM